MLSAMRRRKGFTILELVIVIAVIGILSGILIPTFINLTGKAKTSSDESVIGNLNTAIEMGKHDRQSFRNLEDTMTYLEDYGFSLDSLKPQSDSSILWNSLDKKFVLVEDLDSLVNPYQYFEIRDDVPSLAEQKCSFYLNNSELEIENLEIKVGFDAGKNNHIDSVSYANNSGPHRVVIRTNGSNLTVDAPEDEIIHSGEANYINISEVSHSSFYEYGSSEFTTIESGRIVVTQYSEVGGIFLKGNDAIVAKTEEAELPKVTRSDSVSSTSVQIVEDNGDVISESTLAIAGNTVTPTGNVPPAVIEDVSSGLVNSVNEDTERLATKYEVRIGAAVEGDESNYRKTFLEAFNEKVSATTATTFYLLRDIVTTETIVLSGAATKTHVLNLNNFSIKGVNCCPLSIQINYTFTITTGSLIGDESHAAIKYQTATSSKYVTLTNVDTVGAISNTSTVTTSYYRVNGGVHTKCSFEGKVLVGVASSTTYFDCDPSSILNTVRCQSVLTDGLYKVTRKTQSTSNKVGSGNDGFTRYATIAEAIQYDDFPTLAVRLIGNYSENLESTTTKTISFATSPKIGTSPSASTTKYTFTGSLKTSGSMTFTYGTYDISNIACKTLTLSAYATVNIPQGTMTAITANGASSVLNISGGTCSGKVTVYKSKSNTVNISGGTFTKTGLGFSSSGSTWHVYVTGGTYKTSTIYNTFKSYLQSGYKAVTNSDKTVSVVPEV